MTQTSSTPPSPPGVPILGHSVPFVRDPFGFIRRAVDSTGDVFRMQLLGRDVHIVANPTDVETVLLDRETFAKLDDFEIAFGETLLAVEGDQWRRQRHAMEDFFSPARIREYAETMVDVTDARVDDWADRREVRADEEMRTLALENLFEVIFGQALSPAEADDLADTAHALNLWFKPSSWALPHWVPTPARRKFRRGSRRLRDRARTLLDSTTGGPDEGSLLATLTSLQNDPESGFDREEILDQVSGMVFAGHETTALAMTYALHQIGAHPDVAERVYAELDAAFEGRPSLADLGGLDYLDRVVNETLRLYPPVHGIPRVTTQRTELGGYSLPANADVLLAVWNIHHDPRFYENPREFTPSRWAETSPRERGYEFVPFGSGPRICIGRHFARLEMKAVLATVARRYRIDATGGLDVSPQMTSQPDDPVRLRFERRD